jgi:hypothetical protein
MDTRALSTTDLLVVLKLAALGRASVPVRELARDLGISKSAAALSLERLRTLGLLRGEGDDARIVKLELRECLEHAVRWLAPATIGDWELGLPTAHASHPLAKRLRGDDDPVVMPLAHGPMRGRVVSPIHPRAPFAAQRDPRLHELLSLVDAFRIGRARDRSAAAAELRQRL